MAKHNKLLEKFKKKVLITVKSWEENKKNQINGEMNGMSEFGFCFKNEGDRIVLN